MRGLVRPVQSPVTREALFRSCLTGFLSAGIVSMASSASTDKTCGPLVPRNRVTFYQPKGAFTPIYESKEEASYSKPFASVNAGAFALFVGGGAINRAFAMTLHAAGHKVQAYQLAHRYLYSNAEAKGLGVGELANWKDVADQDVSLPGGVVSSSILRSSLEARFLNSQTLAGTVFIDVFEDDKKPMENPDNVAMAYLVGPEGSQAEGPEDFLEACKYAGNNLMTALTLHNKAGTVPKIEVFRMCLVSGGIFKHPDTSKLEIAKAFIQGLSSSFDPDSSPDIEFAYDEDAYKMAYEELAAAEGQGAED
mmetsp:Transcript_30146/g.47262  ORF Transcript_30146/g.47262 Transcript_30146/m.47262 type:complete len:308 (+) Transcript_30146:49-972(+)